MKELPPVLILSASGRELYGRSAFLARLQPHGQVEAVVEPPVLLGPTNRAQKIL
jgi:hypothetical protein